MAMKQQLVINNFIKKIEIYIQIIGGKTIIQDDVVMAHLNIPGNPFNLLLPTYSSVYDVHVLQQQIDEVPFKGYPLSIWIETQYVSDDWLNFVQNYQLEEIERNMMMKLEHVMDDQQSPSPQLEITKVKKEIDIKGYLDVFVSLFDDNLAVDTLKQYFHMFSQLNRHENVQMFVGYEGEIAVTTGMLIEDDHSYGIYDLMTKELFRAKGYGSSMIHFLLKQIKDKQKQVVLQASSEGIGIYKHFGFIEVGEMFVFE